MGRFEPTAEVDVPHLKHSVIELSWGALRGAHGPSDGSMGGHSNVPSALAVIRHAQIFSGIPEEIDDAFRVLEDHAIHRGLLYPVAITVTPFLFDCMRRSSPVSERLADVIASYAAAIGSLDVQLATRMRAIFIDHSDAIMAWAGRFDRALAAVVVYVSELRSAYLNVIASTPAVSPYALLALIELGAPPNAAITAAADLLDAESTPHGSRRRCRPRPWTTYPDSSMACGSRRSTGSRHRPTSCLPRWCSSMIGS
jgi:hypothetical protein